MLNMAALAVQCGVLVDQGIMVAIVRIESGGNPNALSVNGDVELVREPRNREEAVTMARWLEKHGYNFDAGLGQVNSANLARLGLDVVSVFDPCANLRAASRVLHECYDRASRRWGEGERAVTAALSCYNTGHLTRGVANGYAGAVRANASGPLVAQGSEGTAGPTRVPSRKEVAPKGAEGGGSRDVVAKRPAEVFGEALADAFGVAGRAVKQ
jgi:type IV secretion system protein VirB1